MNVNDNGFLATAIDAARHAGQVIMANAGRLTDQDIDLKQASDFVTTVDRASEDVIIGTIRNRYPDHLFLAEESYSDTRGGAYRWIIDPLDGTTNFIHGFPVFSVSIALQEGGEVVTGVIYNPVNGELFHAEKGRGAFLNDRPIRVSSGTSMEKSLVTTGFPFRRKQFIDDYLRLFRRLFLRVSDLRRAGSAALDLAYVACGRCDGFFELGLSAWDIAAGSILITEAGGVISDFGGGKEYLLTGNTVAGAPPVQAEILREVRKIFRGTVDR